MRRRSKGGGRNLARLAGITIGIGLYCWGLLSPWAWGQPFPPQPTRLEVTVELRFFSEAPLELALGATLLHSGWQLSGEFSRELTTQTPSWEFRLHEQVIMRPATLGVGLRWGSDPPAIDLTALWNELNRKANLTLNFSSQGLQGLFSGSLKEEGFQLQIEQLRFSKAGMQLQKQMTLLWSPMSQLHLQLTLQPLSSPFMEAKLEYMAGEHTSWSALGRFPHELDKPEVEVAVQRGDVGLGVTFNADAQWKGLWLKGRRSLKAGSFEGKLFIGPQGWKKLKITGQLDQFLPQTQLQGNFQLHSTLAWEAALSAQVTGEWGSFLRSRLRWNSHQEWGLHAQGQLLELFGSLQGQLDWGQAGSLNLSLLGDLYLEDASIQSSFTYTSGFWLLDLSGTLPFDQWELLSTLSWSSLFGFESGSLGVTRFFSF